MCFTERATVNPSSAGRSFRGSKHKHPIPRWISSDRQRKKASNGVNVDNITVVRTVPKITEAENTLKVCYLNARSVNNKSQQIAEHITDEQIDLCAVTETWLTSESNRVTLGNLTPEGYTLMHVPRKDKKGGGVAIICRSSLKVTVQPTEELYETFERIEVLLSSSKACIRLSVIYRPPSSSIQQFLSDFQHYMDSHATTSGQLLLIGDFNIHYESSENPNAQRFHDLVEWMNLQQHVNDPTHDRGHILDLVITRDGEEVISDLSVCPFYLSDHSVITFKLDMGKPLPIKKKIRIRKVKDIDVEEFIKDLEHSILIQNPPSALDDLVECYNSSLTLVLDKHAPIREKEVILRPNAPWYTESILQAKHEKRRAERKWQKTRLEVDKQILKNKQKEANDACDKAKKDYYNSKIEETTENSKELFRLANKLLHKAKDSSLPTHTCEKTLANQFGQYFTQKIENIQQQFEERAESTDHLDTSHSFPELTSFSPISIEDLSKLIQNGNSKSCPLDPVPTTLLKAILPHILPSIHTIVLEAIMPSSLKNATVTPLLKKPGLDKENQKNYRPVSNLPYLGKTIEKAAIVQIESHLSTNDLHEPLQSAYTANHSTETALVKVTNDILQALDNNKCVFLVLLDLSAAFDTINHSVFLERLDKEYGVTGSVSNWMGSYLNNRTQAIGINGTLSDTIDIKYGFPQGSCIGPFGFKLYTKPLSHIAQKHSINIHLYSDDTQLYVDFHPSDSEAALSRLEDCIEDIRVWMGQNFLKLNEEKTEFLIFGSKQNIKKITAWTVSVGDAECLPSTSARNIGAQLDSALNMNSHVNSIIRASYYQLRHLAKIRQYLTIASAQKLVHAFITSRLDNFNSLLYKLPNHQITCLQLVQNHAARLILRQKKSCHITPLLKQLHWLPVELRIQYKLLLLVWKCLHQTAPSYLSSLLQPYAPLRALRSSSLMLLQESTTHRKYGERAFAAAGPHLWNALPLTLRTSSTVLQFKS